jgi:hypothetical protein
VRLPFRHTGGSRKDTGNELKMKNEKFNRPAAISGRGCVPLCGTSRSSQHYTTTSRNH